MKSLSDDYYYFIYSIVILSQHAYANRSTARFTLPCASLFFQHQSTRNNNRYTHSQCDDTFVAAAIKQNSSFVKEIRHLLLRLDLPRGTAGIVSLTGSIFYSNWRYSDLSIMHYLMARGKEQMKDEQDVPRIRTTTHYWDNGIPCRSLFPRSRSVSGQTGGNDSLKLTPVIPLLY
jgi:hypothetical protein